MSNQAILCLQCRDITSGRIGTLAHWIFSRESLTEFVEQAQEELE